MREESEAIGAASSWGSCLTEEPDGFNLDAVAALRGIFSLNRKYQDLHFRKVTLATGQKTDQGNWGGSGSVRNLLE